MAANNSTTAAAFINPPPPPPPLLFYAPPPLPAPVMVPSPFGVYYTFPTYTYYTHQYQPLFTNPRPAFPVVHHQSATATDYPQNFPTTDSSQRNSIISRSSETPTVPRTTLIIHNIPKNLRRVSLLKFLDRCCQPYPDLEYDFFHLPLDYWSGCHKEYAFVNLTTNDGAKKLMKILNGYKWRGIYDGVFIRSKKVCNIKWVCHNHQGKEAQIRNFEKVGFNCVDDEFSPLIFDPPRNASDPNPTPPYPLRRNYV